MKKNWMLFLFFAAISVFTFSACSDDDNDTPDASAVSNLVRKHLIPNIHKPGLWNGK